MSPAPYYPICRRFGSATRITTSATGFGKSYPGSARVSLTIPVSPLLYEFPSCHSRASLPILVKAISLLSPSWKISLPLINETQYPLSELPGPSCGKRENRFGEKPGPQITCGSLPESFESTLSGGKRETLEGKSIHQPGASTANGHGNPVERACRGSRQEPLRQAW